MGGGRNSISPTSASRTVGCHLIPPNMRYTSILILLTLVTAVTYSQNNPLFRKITPTDNLKIICLTDPLDSLQVNKRFTLFSISIGQIGKGIQNLP
jgi:hypothetical protein